VTDGIIQIDQELCTACKRCGDNCPVDAIEGEQGKPQTVCEERCVNCGQCIQICSAYDSIFDDNLTPRATRLRERSLFPSLKEPLFAVYDRNCLADVKAALADAGLFTMVQCDSTVSSAIPEDFGLAAGSLSPGQVAASLKKLGFQKAYNTNSLAAFSILEEAHELIERLNCGRVLPVIDSSCPAAVKFIEQSYPELIHYLSSCKSPHQVAGALFKSYGAKRSGIDPASVYSVSVVPCTSRKFEANRPEMKADDQEGRREVDAVLTTRELAYLIKDAGIDIFGLPPEEFDKDLADIPWLANVYCTTGDVTQAVLHTSPELLTNGARSPLNIAFADAQTEGARVTSVRVDQYDIKAVAVSGLRNAIPFLEAIKAGKREFGFMEIRACPMGCVSGGGQPKVLLPQDKLPAYIERANLTSFCSAGDRNKISEHAAVQQVYQGYFKKPYGDKSNRILHTQYAERRLGH
jgi:iron only hydrogenase large subunit-like protein